MPYYERTVRSWLIPKLISRSLFIPLKNPRGISLIRFLLRSKTSRLGKMVKLAPSKL